MKLVLKVPKGKPPFIGVEYAEFQADRENHDLVKYHSNKEYRIILEPYGTGITLLLICEELVTVRTYKYLNYDPRTLKDWLLITKGTKVYNFGHVYLNGTKHEIARLIPSLNKFVLKVTSIQIDETKFNRDTGALNDPDGFEGLSIA